MSNARSIVACPDPREGLLAEHAVVQISDTFRMRAAQELARLGVVDLTRRAVLRCIHPPDGDVDAAVDPFCEGEIYLRGDAWDPFGPYHCPSCGRSLDATQKQKFGVYLVSRNMTALRRSMEAKLRETGLGVREYPERCFRLGARDYATVLLVDDANDKLLTRPMSQPPLIVYTGDLLHTSRRDVTFSSISAVEVLLGPGDRFRSLVWKHIASFPFEEDEGEDDPPLLALPPAGGFDMRSEGPVRGGPRQGEAPAAVRLRWSQIKLQFIDGHVLRVTIGGVSRRMSFFDLGMASGPTREPTKPWETLREACENGGIIAPGNAGDRAIIKRRLSRVRVPLQRTFGMTTDPFHPFVPGVGWRAKFATVSSVTVDDVQAQDGDEDD